jgi:hypothetical protein
MKGDYCKRYWGENEKNYRISIFVTTYDKSIT